MKERRRDVHKYMSKADRKKQDRQGLLLIGASLVLLAGVAGGVMAGRPPERVAETGCIKEQLPSQQHLIIVDLSEEWDAGVRDVLGKAIHNVATSADVEDRVTVIAFHGGEEVMVTPLFDRCRVPQGKDVNALVSATNQVERQFQSVFAEPLSKALAAIAPKNARETRLVTFLAHVLAAHHYQPGGASLTLHLFSDMGVHGPDVSLLGKKPVGGEAFSRYVADKLGTRLQGVRLEVHVVPTASTKGKVGEEIKKVWSQALSGVGADFDWRPL